MGFYHLSLISLLLFFAYFAIAALVIDKVCGMRTGMRNCLLAVAFIAPWAEEIWIAYNFGQMCRKDAGKFISKIVQVDGYYNDTYGGVNTVVRIVGGPPYKFIESRDENNSKFRRVERASEVEKSAALAWYESKNRDKNLNSKERIIYPVDERTQVIVELDTGYAWRITKLDKPTARYHFSMDTAGVAIGHKIHRQEYRVTDSIAGEIIGKLVIYSRSAYWFYIGLSAQSIACDSPNPLAGRSHSLMIEREVLKPNK